MALWGFCMDSLRWKKNILVKKVCANTPLRLWYFVIDFCGKNCGGACLFLISNTYLSVPERNSDHILGRNSEKKNFKKNGWPPWNIVIQLETSVKSNFAGILVINWSFHVLSKEILPGLKIISFFCFCLKYLFCRRHPELQSSNWWLSPIQPPCPHNPPVHTTHLFLLCMTTQPELPFHTQFDCLSRPTIPC